MKKSMFRLAALGLIVSGLLSCMPRQDNSNDVFQRSSPEKEGMRTEGILRFLEEVQTRRIDMHSLMILRHGKVVTEGWWYPYKPDYRHIMHSVSKTFTSTAIGFAVDEKLLSVNDKVISFFPDELPEDPSPYLAELSIRHLLTMSVGQEPAPSFALSDGDWVKRFLATPIVHRPGTVFLYSSFASHMLSAIIQKVSGQTTFDYLKPRLFDPLHITGILWEADAQGITMGGWGMRIRTEDMARLGQFYLQEGRWNGRQLLSEAWIKEASSLQIYQRDSLTLEEELHNNWVQGYGYQIWRCTHNAYRADGANGQFIIIMPEQDAVVVITENTQDTQQILRLVSDHLLPMMTDRPYTVEEEDREQLIANLSALAIPDPFRTAEELEIAKSTVRMYAIEANDRQIENVSFTFDAEGGCQLRLDSREGAQAFAFGPDAWRYGETEKLSPYFLIPRRNPEGLAPFAVAGYSSWTADDELRLRLLYIEDYQEETYVCRFEGDRLEMSLSQSADPSAQTLVLTGSLQ
ncbi:MAG: beta-lactamase family protein [Tannerellaceae bacterium]|jgi:CubicO group peptidase (beta-lactamase class C family)|nr:beta-lactamase family protein [Tannerellaceae bacterium]